MTGYLHRIAPAALAAILLTACAAPPGASLTFQDMQARQAAIQAVLAAGDVGTPRPWRSPDGTTGAATLVSAADAEGCRQVSTTGPGGAITDTWCPTPHGFWVHPDELFYRNATGRETYGGAVRSRDGADGVKAETEPADTRPDQIDCLRLLREEQRLSDGGREGAARAARRAFHDCLKRSR
ncbi:hypothetical protein RJ527_15505 [Thalassospiraceae bacterium LMO-SO8]|nr:hypothetical protein [Alphaproteobacteria bacterium LMO-S08]WND75430.1 hypothetical protein RJ527_15505 [Thalassospiraceae bacterium LMO-SO8]